MKRIFDKIGIDLNNFNYFLTETALMSDFIAYNPLLSHQAKSDRLADS